jgi:hypothetical protein
MQLRRCRQEGATPLATYSVPINQSKMSLRSRLLWAAQTATIVIAVNLTSGAIKAQTIAFETPDAEARVFQLLDGPPSASPALPTVRDDDGLRLLPPVDAPSAQARVPMDGRGDRLIDRVVDPISWLMQFRFRDDWNWPVEGAGPDSQEFQFRPTIPFTAWERANLLRIRVPYMIQGKDAPGLGPVEMEDAIIFEPEWGRLGVGPAVRFNPDSGGASDEFQMGPLFAAVGKTKRWTYGFISQSFLGSSDSETDIQPILAFKFNEQLALTLGEMQFKYDWNKRQWKQIPLGIELDYIADLWGQKMQFFVNPQYNFERTASNSGWTVYLGIVLLVPEA